MDTCRSLSYALKTHDKHITAQVTGNSREKMLVIALVFPVFECRYICLVCSMERTLDDN